MVNDTGYNGIDSKYARAYAKKLRRRQMQQARLLKMAQERARRQGQREERAKQRQAMLEQKRREQIAKQNNPLDVTKKLQSVQKTNQDMQINANQEKRAQHKHLIDLQEKQHKEQEAYKASMSKWESGRQKHINDAVSAREKSKKSKNGNSGFSSTQLTSYLGTISGDSLMDAAEKAGYILTPELKDNKGYWDNLANTVKRIATEKNGKVDFDDIIVKTMRADHKAIRNKYNLNDLLTAQASDRQEGLKPHGGTSWFKRWFHPDSYADDYREDIVGDQVYQEQKKLLEDLGEDQYRLHNDEDYVRTFAGLVQSGMKPEAAREQAYISYFSKKNKLDPRDVEKAIHGKRISGGKVSLNDKDSRDLSQYIIDSVNTIKQKRQQQEAAELQAIKAAAAAEYERRNTRPSMMQYSLPSASVPKTAETETSTSGQPAKIPYGMLWDKRLNDGKGGLRKWKNSINGVDGDTLVAGMKKDINEKELTDTLSKLSPYEQRMLTFR